MTDSDEQESTRRVLEYHLPDDTQFALRHVTDDPERHQRRCDDLSEAADGESDVEIRTVEESVGGTTAYLIYTKRAPEAAFPDFETDAEILEWLHERFDVDDLPVVLTVFRIFRGIVEEKQAHGNELDLYKHLQFEKLPDILDRVEWRQPVPAVGAELLSRFVLAHPMPNANHRTGIALLDRYLTAVDPTFEMPDPGEEGEWYDWAVDFVHESKRLLTLRREVPKFRYAAAIGYETVRRKEDVEIDLTAHDLERDDARKHYTEAHLERSRAFVDTVLEQADAEDLQHETDDGKRAFVDRLRRGE